MTTSTTTWWAAALLALAGCGIGVEGADEEPRDDGAAADSSQSDDLDADDHCDEWPKCGWVCEEGYRRLVECAEPETDIAPRAINCSGWTRVRFQCYVLASDPCSTGPCPRLVDNGEQTIPDEPCVVILGE